MSISEAVAFGRGMEMIMMQLKVKFTGLAPLLMHSGRGANPLDEATQEHSELTHTKTKTEKVHQQIAESEWNLSLYYDKATGPYIPSGNIETCMWKAAKMRKLGEKFLHSFMVLEPKVPLLYSGPRNPDQLFANKNFVDMRGVVISRRRIQRCRPKFDNWSTDVTFVFDDEQIKEGQIKLVAADAGRFVGLGDYRPKFGKFEVAFN